MKPRIPFDEQVREQLEQIAPEVPAHVWERIQNQNKRRRLAFWYSLGGILLIVSFIILITGALFWWNHKFVVQQEKTSSNRKVNVSSASSQEKEINPKVQSANVSAIPNHAENRPIASESAILSAEEKRQGHRQDQAVAPAPLLNGVNGISLPQTFEQHPLNTQRKQSSEVKQISSTKQKKRTTSARSRMKVIPALPVASPETIADNISEESRVTTTRIINEYIQQHPYDSVIHEMNSVQVPDSGRGLKISDSIGLQKLVVSATSDKKEDIPCPGGDNEAANRKYIDVYGSFDYGIRQFSDTAHSTYLQSRKESTRFSSAFSGGLRYTRVFNNGVSIRAGFNFTQINETFRFVQGNIIQVVYIINANGDTTGSYQTQSTRYKTTHNKYKTLDIPLMLGYEYGKGKWFLNFSGGVMINLRSWSAGEVLDYSLQPVNVGESAAPSVYQFRKNIGWAGVISGTISYQAAKKMRLFGEPYFRFNFSTMSKDELTFKQKYHLAGLRIGLSVDF